MDEIDKLLQRIEALTTADYFPAIYEGFVEAEALEQGEDALLGIMSSYVLELWQNRNLLSMDDEKTSLFEKQLHIVPTPSQSLDDRRAAVADAINERFVLNDATLHEICQSLAPDFTVYEKTDPQALTLGVFTEEDDAQGGLPAVGIVNEIRPTVPQNLALYAGVDTSFERPLVVSHANFSALWAGLGVVEWHEPPEPPEPIAPKGYIVVDSGGSIQHSVDLGDMFIHQIQHSVEVVNFYFTANGAAEVENSNLESGVDVTLYNADGTVADDALYDGSGTLTYTQANGNMFEAADGGDLISLQSGALVVNPKTDYTALSVQVEKVEDNYIEVLLGLRWRSDHWGSEDFDYNSGNYWYGGILSAEDQQRLIDFGCAIDKQGTQQVGQYGQITFDGTNFIYEPIAFYADQAGTIENQFDISEFYCIRYSPGWFTVWCNTRYQATSIVWRCKITKLNP